jgi:hypothetical protein
MSRYLEVDVICRTQNVDSDNMHVHVRTYVCINSCTIYVCMYVYMYVCMYACMDSCMSICMYVCMYVRNGACRDGTASGKEVIDVKDKKRHMYIAVYACMPGYCKSTLQSIDQRGILRLAWYFEISVVF